MWWDRIKSLSGSFLAATQLCTTITAIAAVVEHRMASPLPRINFTSPYCESIFSEDEQETGSN
jgi:hypothetical protein